MATSSRTWAKWIGRFSERLVMFRYLAAGYTCLETNWRSRDGELDLVLRRRDKLIFVEVKARRLGGLVSAVDSFSVQKYQRVRRCALLYQHRFGLDDLQSVIELVAVTWRCGWPSVQRYTVDHEAECYRSPWRTQ